MGLDTAEAILILRAITTSGDFTHYWRHRHRTCPATTTAVDLAAAA